MLFAFLFLLFADGEPADKKEEPKIQERFLVIGSSAEADKTPGSAHFIEKKELEKHSYSDVHRILGLVPGINIQEEEGYGLRPNIGMRGTGVERSGKITLMEDGVLIAPAPYTAPSAYYFPTAGRMSAFEIKKGPATIESGPQSNGGTLNMVSTPIPLGFSSELGLFAGSHETYRLNTNVGFSNERYGFVAETYQFDTQGFKDLPSGDKTGTRLQDYLVKGRWNSSADASWFQSLELKLGKTKQFGHETYLGLTESDFERTPNVRYASSELDTMDTDHNQFQVRHFLKPTSNFDLSTTVYFNDFKRNWHKFERINGISNSSILSSPENYQEELSIIRGDVDSEAGALGIRNNNRSYYGAGIHSIATFNKSMGHTSHELRAGIRYHEDEEDRLQHDEAAQMLSGRVHINEVGTPGSQTNRLSYAEALSFSLTDTIESGNWRIVPGFRIESIDYTREDYSKSDPNRTDGPTRVRKNDVNVFLPGVGVQYQINPKQSVFWGLHKGFSPPGAGQNEETESEESWNYEVGTRFKKDGLKFEVIGFYNDYDNLLGTDTASGGGASSGELYNGGEVNVFGLELVTQTDIFRGNSYRLPLAVTYTHTQSEFKESFSTGFADWSPEVLKGDELPYLPENQGQVSLGFLQGNFSAFLSANYQDAMRTKAGSGAIPEGEGTDARTVFDLSGHYKFKGQYTFTVQLKNVTDETYIVARRPYGVRPGLPQSFNLGFKANF